MKKIYLFVAILCICGNLNAQVFQTSDEGYKQPLDSVLNQLATKFKVKILYNPEVTKNAWVPYADWRLRNSAEKSLINILAPVNLSYRKTDSTTYQVRPFEYYRRSVEEGKEQLADFAKLYQDKNSWEKRKTSIVACMKETLGLTVLPLKPASKPIFTAKRIMNGYTVENIAIETLPGLYVCGSLYRPLKVKGKVPVILCPGGHFDQGRYRSDQQYSCAMLARMGAIALSYDLIAYGESQLQFNFADHRRSIVMAVQTLNNIRMLDFIYALEDADTTRVAVTGASGGGSQTMILTAFDSRINVSAPIVMVSAWYTGGCPCETGLPAHFCAGGTNNVEIAAMAAPRPQLIVSDGGDWTATVPEIEFPYIKKIYGYYGAEDLTANVHLPSEKHDYGLSKRLATYDFFAKHLRLNLIKDSSGKIDESGCTIENEAMLYAFGKNGENLPKNAIKGFDALTEVFEKAISQVNK